MCFSPEMDVAAGLVVTCVGIDALRHVTSRRQVALASLPIVFGVHQLIETFVWLSLRGQVGPCVGDVATYAYLVIALLLVPVLVPWAFLRLGVGRGRWVDVTFLVAGVVAAVLLGDLLFSEPPGRRIDGLQITYFAGQHIPDYVLPVYAFACLGPALLARSRPLQLFGIVNLIAVVTLAALNQGGVISLWCVWAAVTSILINLHLRGVRLGGGSQSSERPSIGSDSFQAGASATPTVTRSGSTPDSGSDDSRR